MSFAPKGLGLVTGFMSTLTAGLGILVAVVALMMSACVLVPNQLEEIDLDVVFQSGADDRFLATRLAFDHIMKKIPSYFLAPFYYQYFHIKFIYGMSCVMVALRSCGFKTGLNWELIETHRTGQENCVNANASGYWQELSDFASSTTANPSTVRVLMILYLVVNAVWFFASVLLLLGSCCGVGFFFRLCRATVAVVLVYDIVLVLVFAADLLTFKDYEAGTYLERMTRQNMWYNIVAMTTVASRFVFLTLASVAFYFVLFIATSQLEEADSSPL